MTPGERMVWAAAFDAALTRLDSVPVEFTRDGKAVELAAWRAMVASDAAYEAYRTVCCLREVELPEGTPERAMLDEMRTA